MLFRFYSASICISIPVVTASCPAAPGQIPAGGITARGSSDYSLRTKLELIKNLIDSRLFCDSWFLDLVMFQHIVEALPIIA